MLQLLESMLTQQILNRKMQKYAEILKINNNPNTCTDIATQLVYGSVGRYLNVILGGGREHILPRHREEGKRLDGRNLIEVWQSLNGSRILIVANKKDILKLPGNTERVMGLFAANHKPYYLDTDPEIIPSLQEMVETALEVLEKQSKGNGYFLYVEGARINHAHHEKLNT